VQSTSFFEHLPEDVVRKMLFENFIDLNKLPAIAKNLMHFASISKFNREFVRVLLREEGLSGISFEITKSVIPNLLTTLANDKKAQFTQEDVDELVHNWLYLTLDSSLRKNTVFTNRGLEALKKIVCHPDLKEVRIINNLPAKKCKYIKNYQTCINNGLELIYSLLSRKESNPLKVYFETNNWLHPFDSYYPINETSFDLIKKIQDSPDNCSGLTFTAIWLSQNDHVRTANFFPEDDPIKIQNKDYQFECVKMMCNIALKHSASTIDLAKLKLSDSELGLMLDEILLCDKSSLHYLDLSGNTIGESAVESLSALLQSKNTCLNFLLLCDVKISIDAVDILAVALKNNFSLKSVFIYASAIAADHPIRNDKRVKLIGGL